MDFTVKALWLTDFLVFFIRIKHKKIEAVSSVLFFVASSSEIYEIIAC